MVVDIVQYLLYSASTAPTLSASSGHLETGSLVKLRPVLLFTVLRIISGYIISAQT